MTAFSKTIVVRLRMYLYMLYVDVYCVYLRDRRPGRFCVPITIFVYT